jgi:hypothetical protein
MEAAAARRLSRSTTDQAAFIQELHPWRRDAGYLTFRPVEWAGWRLVNLERRAPSRPA